MKKIISKNTIQVSEAASAALDRIRDSAPLAKNIITERVLEWVAGQDDAVLKAILGLLPKGHELDVMEVIVKAMRDPPAGRTKAG